MAGKFKRCKFSDCNLADPFFDSLKNDYAEFSDWFNKKSLAKEDAFVFEDEMGLGAFIYLKKEEEKIILKNKVLPVVKRLKIGTLKLAKRQHGQRMGEGAIGIALWSWQESNCEEIYLTVYKSHPDVIFLVEKFGFNCIGEKENGELVYVKSKRQIDYKDPHKAFPFINPCFEQAGVLPVFDYFHDRLFPYSELKGGNNLLLEDVAGNGITKVFVGSPKSIKHFDVGTPVFIFRIFTGSGQKTYKSCITSFATVSKIVIVKESWEKRITFDSFIKLSGNKTIFKEEELSKIYNGKDTVVIFELVYNGFFGVNNNVIHKALTDNNLFGSYPYEIKYSKDDFIKILRMGRKNETNIIIN